jgi:hypothetical protein
MTCFMCNGTGTMVWPTADDVGECDICWGYGELEEKEWPDEDRPVPAVQKGGSVHKKVPGDDMPRLF